MQGKENLFLTGLGRLHFNLWITSKMANEIITFARITNFLKEHLNSIAKGELKYMADFVLELPIHEFTIRGKVRVPMKDKSYSVHLTGTNFGDVIKA